MKLSEIKPGHVIVADNGFTCMAAGPKAVKADDDGKLFVECDEGRHYLDGQEDEQGADLVGLSAS